MTSNTVAPVAEVKALLLRRGDDFRPGEEAATRKRMRAGLVNPYDLLSEIDQRRGWIGNPQ